MKHDKCLKIENLDNELFIEELGQMHGGSQASTSLAGAEEPGWSDTPPQPVFPSPGINIEELLERYGNIPGLPSCYQGPVTSLALGEE